ncbi:hypothetical protein FB451DRAFT_1567464 [Mycena latifolia]|nr:hypothetical protein FB451DRAFT_1567464 [Mycena latifolia]
MSLTPPADAAVGPDSFAARSAARGACPTGGGANPKTIGGKGRARASNTTGALRGSRDALQPRNGDAMGHTRYNPMGGRRKRKMEDKADPSIDALNDALALFRPSLRSRPSSLPPAAAHNGLLHALTVSPAGTRPPFTALSARFHARPYDSDSRYIKRRRNRPARTHRSHPAAPARLPTGVYSLPPPYSEAQSSIRVDPFEQNPNNNPPHQSRRCSPRVGTRVCAWVLGSRLHAQPAHSFLCCNPRLPTLRSCLLPAPYPNCSSSPNNFKRLATPHARGVHILMRSAHNLNLIIDRHERRLAREPLQPGLCHGRVPRGVRSGLLRDGRDPRPAREDAVASIRVEGVRSCLACEMRRRSQRISN